jgi:Pvc16 N-terminal domain/IPT/TIG domain
MSASTAIGMVSASLRSLLVGEMQLTPAVEVTVLAPDESAGARRVNLFLYKIEENRFLKNQDWTVQPGTPNRLVPAPLSLSLFYLMTPYAPNDPLTGNSTAHQVMGDAMRVFYEYPVVPTSYLDVGLIDARERLQIASNALDPQELSRIWGTFSQPFRLSVLYQVNTVQLDPLPEARIPMANRVRQVGVPGIRQPLNPPVVTGMEPVSGAAGATVTFTGTHLEGWRATVTIADRVVATGEALIEDSFTATVPTDLQPGFYDVRVDVSRLFRRSFLFEVTS